MLYLDFNGAVVTGSAWNNFYGSADIIAPFNLDGDPNTFNATELQRILNIWKRVAEDYSPFDVRSNRGTGYAIPNLAADGRT